MESVRIEDRYCEEAEVSVITRNHGDKASVSLEFDPECRGDGSTAMIYSPNQARELAAALILAADEAEKK